mgnify:CR=1 FL=1|jgi:hypothetical protein
MIKRQKARLKKCIIHKVGNKYNDTKNAFSNTIIGLDDVTYDLLVPFTLKPFVSATESFRFHHHAQIELNEINAYSKQIFENDEAFVECSQNIVMHLFEQSNSSQIKTGDVLVCLFDNVQYEDSFVQSLGIFKIETKTDFFQTFKEDTHYDIVVQKGIQSKKVDKGCLILNFSDSEGPIVFSVDHNSYDAQYWTRHFLNIKYPDDHNQHTKNYMEMCREFSKEVLQPQFGGQDHSNFLAKTIDYFKENEVVNATDFEEEVLETEDHLKLFEDFRKSYETEHKITLRNQFEVSPPVVRKQKQKIKTEIKLDTHMKIKIDVDAPDAATEYLERGYDQDKKMHYYKVFFNAES